MKAEYRVPESSPFFMVNRNGEVKSVRDGRVVAQTDNGHGYKQVQISIKGKRYTRYVHRLVAECFLPNHETAKEINHIDGDKSNNSVDNLEWCTHSENIKHAFSTGLRPRTTPKQQEAARRNAALSKTAMREGWKRWAETEQARECWMDNISKADRWGTRNEPAEVKAAKRREKKRIYYQEHKEERSRKAHERYLETKARQSA